MSKKAKRIIVKVTMVMFFIFMLNFNLFSWIKANDSDDGFEPPEGKSNSVIRIYIIEGAGY